MQKDPPPDGEDLARGDGRYRIAAVAELTGVPEPTLRAWERRYGVPVPARTATGYRLYGEHEVQQVRAMRNLCEQGVAAAEAAKIVMESSSTEVGGKGPGARTGPQSEDPFVLAVDGILDAVDRFDATALDQQLRRLMYLGSATEVLDRVLSPALVTIGDRWHSGELSVGQEHFASFKLGTVMRDLIRLLPSAEAAETVVLAAFADDEHEMGLMGVAVRIAHWGLRPLFLGARTPPSAVRSAVEAVSPKLVALSVTVTPPPARARELVDDYAAACGQVPWVVGGAGAAPLADLVSGRGGKLIESGPDFRAMIRPLLSGAAARRETR